MPLTTGNKSRLVSSRSTRALDFIKSQPLLIFSNIWNSPGGLELSRLRRPGRPRGFWRSAAILRASENSATGWDRVRFRSVSPTARRAPAETRVYPAFSPLQTGGNSVFWRLSSSRSRRGDEISGAPVVGRRVFIFQRAVTDQSRGVCMTRAIGAMAVVLIVGGLSLAYRDLRPLSAVSGPQIGRAH